MELLNQKESIDFKNFLVSALTPEIQKDKTLIESCLKRNLANQIPTLVDLGFSLNEEKTTALTLIESYEKNRDLGKCWDVLLPLKHFLPEKSHYLWDSLSKMTLVALFEGIPLGREEWGFWLNKIKKVAPDSIDNPLRDLEKTPLMHFPYHQILIDAGADLNPQLDFGLYYFGKTALHSAASNVFFIPKNNQVSQDYFSELDILIKAGVDINASDDFGNTPIFYSFKSLGEKIALSKEVLDFFIGHGADLLIKNKEGCHFWEGFRPTLEQNSENFNFIQEYLFKKEQQNLNNSLSKSVKLQKSKYKI